MAEGIALYGLIISFYDFRTAVKQVKFMKMFLISDNIDTQTGMRLAGVEGVVVHEREELRSAPWTALADKDIGILLTGKIRQGIPGYHRRCQVGTELPLIIEIPDARMVPSETDFITSYVNEAIGIISEL